MDTSQVMEAFQAPVRQTQEQQKAEQQQEQKRQKKNADGKEKTHENDINNAGN